MDNMKGADQRKRIMEIFINAFLFLFTLNEFLSTIEDYHGTDSTVSGIGDLMLEDDKFPPKTYYFPW
jgi:hypothetical protein